MAKRYEEVHTRAIASTTTRMSNHLKSNEQKAPKTIPIVVSEL